MKHMLYSRVLWFNLVVTLVVAAQALELIWLVADHEALAMSVALVNIGLRVSTRQGIWIVKQPQRDE